MKKYWSFCFLFFFYGLKAFTQNSVNDQSIQNDFQNYSRTEGSKNYSGSYLPVFSNKENTVGSRYLFDKWVDGRVMNTDNIIISTDSFLFVYDKIAGKLLATQDKKKVIEVDDAAVKSFTLINGNDTLVFEKLPAVSDHGFFIELVKNKDHYSLYKSLTTKFVKADYFTNGIFESGKKYDEFVDAYEYYIVLPGGNDFKKVTFKRKSVKDALTKEDKKVREFFSKSEDGIIDESFLKGLIVFLNH